MKKTVIIFNADKQIPMFQYKIIKEKEYRELYANFSDGRQKTADINKFLCELEDGGIIKQKPLNVELVRYEGV